MHKIIENCLKKFSTENSIDSEEISKQFEFFVNSIIAYDRCPANFDFRDITSDDVDGGIDGIIFYVDDELATTLDEVQGIFSRHKKNISVDIIFIQSKTSEKYDRGEILKFTNGVEDFIDVDSVLPQGPFIADSKKIFNFIIENVAKVRNGRPNCIMYFVCTSNNEIAPEIEAAKLSAIKKVRDSGFFNEVTFEYIGLEQLMKLWTNMNCSTSATITVENFFPYPTMSGVTESYIAIISAKEFIEKLLLATDGKMKLHIFEENVRAFLGRDNPVNTKIKETLTDKKRCDKFAIYNNGITIISPDVKVQNKKFSLDNYQIVNGCQTSNVLYECKEADIDSAFVTVKIIEAADPDVISDIVSATNNQSKVDDNQFLAFKPFIRRLEKYFDATQDIPNYEIKLYFERRLGQYKNSDVPKKRIYSITDAGRAVGALFLLKPDLASRYPNRFVAETATTIFDEKNREEAFYIASLVDFRLKPFYQKTKILNRYAIYKWHIITIFGFLATNTYPPKIQNKQNIQKYGKKILQICTSEDKLQILVGQIPLILEKIGLKTNRDEVRSATYAKSVLEYCAANLVKN